MNADTNVAANFAGGLRVESPQVTTHVNVNGKEIGTADPSSPVANLVIAYGATVEILAQQNVTFIGAACNVGSDPTAVVTATTCTFTMYPGANAGGFGITVNSA
jgi:hypothetical protein